MSVRLPIYGETTTDVALKALRQDGSFGEYLCETSETQCADPDSEDEFADLLFHVDACIDPVGASIHDFATAVRSLAEDGIDLVPDLAEAESLFCFARGVAVPYDYVHECITTIHRPPVVRGRRVDHSTIPQTPGVYFVEAVGTSRIKIGVARRLRDRIQGLQTASPVPLRLLGFVDGDDEEERRLHRAFGAYRTIGEWFEAAAEIVEYIAKHGRRT